VQGARRLGLLREREREQRGERERREIGERRSTAGGGGGWEARACACRVLGTGPLVGRLG
jgi:hypothetical protein